MNEAAAPFALPCGASALRRELKHDYLTNTACLMAVPADLLESMLRLEEAKPRHQIIRDRMAELIDLLDKPGDGFSPAQLLDDLAPFRSLASETRECMRAQVQRQFAEEFELGARKTRLQQRSEQFSAALDSFLNKARPNPTSATALMEQVHEAARELIRELESLPKGIWLWPASIAREEADNGTTQNSRH